MKRSKLLLICFGVLIFLIAYKQFFPKTSSTEIIDDTLPLELVWSQRFTEDLFIPPVSNGEIFVVMDEKGVLTALDSQTGTRLWQYELGNQPDTASYSKMAIGEGRLIVSLENNKLLALNVQTGEKIWQASLVTPLWNFPTIVIANDMVVIGAWDARTNGYLGGYHLQDGRLSWEMSFPARNYRFLFDCSPIPTQAGLLENAVCVIPNNRILVINITNEWPANLAQARIADIYEPISTLTTPVFADGFIFTNPSPDPAVNVFDIIQNSAFKLPASCSKENAAHPVTVFGNEVLVANGCNEVYVLNTSQLTEAPKWIFQSPDELQSSFVTIDGKVGYFLNEKGEIIGIDLVTGNQVGKIDFSIGQLQIYYLFDGLAVDGSRLYVVLNNREIFSFRSE